MRCKIKRGEFVDLEHLLPKDRLGGKQAEERKLEIFSRDGVAYFASTSDKNGSKINGLRWWEQAFRVYAAVYSRANPNQAPEIWQYVHIINLAASAYSWDNVSFYDHTFRQLMSSNPNWSWAKLYNQGWNLAMTEPLGKGGNNFTTHKSGRTRASGSSKKDWHDYCCWRFNKNKCDRGSNCDWDHRYTYCGGWYHSFLSCRKRLKKEGRARLRSPPSKRKSPAKLSIP